MFKEIDAHTTLESLNSLLGEKKTFIFVRSLCGCTSLSSFWNLLEFFVFLNFS